MPKKHNRSKKKNIKTTDKTPQKKAQTTTNKPITKTTNRKKRKYETKVLEENKHEKKVASIKKNKLKKTSKKNIKNKKQKEKNIFSTAIIIVILLITTIYIFLIIDKKNSIKKAHSSLEQITNLQSDIAYLDGKYEIISNTLKENKKIVIANQELTESITTYKKDIDDLESKIGKMEK